MKITKMLMLELGTYNDPFQRSYKSHVDGISLQQLQESTQYGRNLTPAALGPVGADIMRLDSTVGAAVNIDQGFDQQRMCFMMEVEFPGTGGMLQVEYLMGYTNHVGVTARFGDTSIVFDKNMRLYFNNVMSARRITAAHSFGRNFHTTVNGTYQLINGDYRPEITNLHQAPHLMRPQDVFTTASMENTRRLVGGEDVYDARSTHGPERLAVSHRRNTIPGQYLSAMLQTWQANSMTDEVDPASMYSQMAASVAEPTISRIRTLQQLATMSELRIGGSVLWSELLGADDTGTLENRAVVVLAQSDDNRHALSRRGDMEYWNGNGNVTIIGTSFVQAVPGMMMNLMLTELDFSVTNKTLDGSWDVIIQGVQSFNDGDNIDQVEAFKYKLAHELMPGLSRGNLHEIEIFATFNVVGQTFIEISVDGSALTPFMAPSFCDGMFAAVRAPDIGTLDRFSDNLSKIISNLETDQSAGGRGYEPSDTQFSPIVNTQGNRYENSGTL